MEHNTLPGEGQLPAGGDDFEQGSLTAGHAQAQEDLADSQHVSGRKLPEKRGGIPG